MSMFKNVTDKVSGTAKAAAQKSGEVVQITKLNRNISLDEEKIEKIFNELGKGLFELYSSGEEINETFIEKCETIKALKDNIEEMNHKILELKGLKACPTCGYEMEIEAVYCSKCGTKQ